jgi:hypothetical protein
MGRARLAVSFRRVGFAPMRVTVELQGHTHVRVPGGERPRPLEVAARATAELAPEIGGLGIPAQASGGGYDRPLS